ncbi:MAG: hypothetical protein ACP5JG_13485 [Anaerolineae bacterium]
MNGKHISSRRIITGLILVVTLSTYSVPMRALAAEVAPAEAARVPNALDPRSAKPDRDRRAAVFRSVVNLLGYRDRSNQGFLADWPDDRLRRLEVWLTLGITFEGEWASEELDAVLRVLDAFGALYGEGRFLELTDAALGLRGDRKGRHLAVVREPGSDIPAAVWRQPSGQIAFSGGAFDRELLEYYYYWGFLLGEYAQLRPGISRREVIIGHELGHVAVDGLRAEAAAEGYSQISLEGLYRHAIPAEQWPHGYARTKENLVTELALWALDVERTPEAARFRDDFLAATIAGREWPHHVARSFALASADGAR